MVRRDRVAAVVALVGLAGVALVVSGAVPADSGGATYYLATDPVENGSVPADATVTSYGNLSGPTVDAVTASLVGNASTVTAPRRVVDAAPAYVRFEAVVYRVETGHVDRTVDLHGYAVLFGGAAAFVGGSVAVFALRRRDTGP